MRVIRGPQLGTAKRLADLSGKRRPLWNSMPLNQCRRILRRVTSSARRNHNGTLRIDGGLEARGGGGFSLLATACRTCHREGQTPLLPNVSAGRAVGHLRRDSHPKVVLTWWQEQRQLRGASALSGILFQTDHGPCYIGDGGTLIVRGETRAAWPSTALGCACTLAGIKPPKLTATTWSGLAETNTPYVGWSSGLPVCCKPASGRAIHRLRRAGTIIRSFFHSRLSIFNSLSSYPFHAEIV